MKDYKSLDDTDMVLAPIDALTLSAMNPRQIVTDQEINELASSIAACGLIQGLSGYRTHGGAIEIVAGGRRLRALQLLAAEGFIPAPNHGLDLTRIPVKVTTDIDLAAKWAMAENVARKAPNIADEVVAYKALSDRGASFANIAHAFAVTEIHVKRRLKLAHLPAAALDALRADKIGYGQAAVLTLCKSEDEIKALLALTLDGKWDEQRMRRHVVGEMVSGDSGWAKYVGLDAYEAAGGGVVRDLFTDHTALADGPLIEKLYHEKLCAEAAQIRLDTGFKWAEAVFEGWVPYSKTQSMTRIWPSESFTHNEAEALEYADLMARSDGDGLDDEIEEQRLAELMEMTEATFSPEQRSVSGIFVFINRDGVAKYEAAYVTADDHEQAVELGVVVARPSQAAAKADGESKADEPAFSAAVIADLKAIRLASIQTALLDRDDLLADLLAFAVSPHAGQYSAVFDLRLGRPPIVPSVDEGFDLDKRLDSGATAKADLAEGFSAFRKLPKAQRQAALHAAVARTLNYGCAPQFGKPSLLFEVIEAEAGADMRRVWRPTKSNFFGRVTSPYLDEIYQEVFALKAASPAAKEFAGLKKSEKAAKLELLFDPDKSQGHFLMTPEAAARIAAWLPYL